MTNPEISPKKSIIFSVINDYVGDQRVQRIAGFWHEQGYEVKVLCRELPDSLPLPELPYQVRRMRLWTTKGKLFYAEFSLRLLVALLFEKSDIWVANDLDTLLPNYLVARLKGKKLVYDSHEYFTECPEIVSRPFVQRVWLQIERFIFPKVRYAYTVNDSIANIYSEKYGLNVQVIKNLPVRTQSGQQQPQPKPDVLLYQGALNLGRGIELMIAALDFLPEYELWIVGKGDVENALRKQAEGKANVRFWGFQPPAELKKITPQAKLGLSLEEDLGGNYHFASPNKLVDYIQAGVPYLCSDLPEMRRLTSTFDCGELLGVDERTPKHLAERIRNLCENELLYQQKRANCATAATELCWENERGKLLGVYGEGVG